MSTTPESGPHEVAPPLRSGRYRLREVLGEGGMAVVYRAWDSRLEVERAVKLLLPAMAARPRIRERFHAEARTMAKLSHPHIVAVQDVDAEDDRVFIVMELLGGGTLWDWVEQHGPMPPRLAVDGMVPVLAALQAAHDRGVVHRDVKPQNVLLTAGGVPKMTDFGIARIPDSDSRTRTAAVMGTWTYMPPEQRNSAKDTDARSDVYAAGAMLWALLRGEDPPDLFAADMDPSLLGGLPSPLAEIVRQSTRYRREERFGSAAAMAAALEACRAALPELPAGVTGPQAASPLTAAPLGSLAGTASRQAGVASASSAGGGADPAQTLPPDEASGPVPSTRSQPTFPDIPPEPAESSAAESSAERAAQPLTMVPDSFAEPHDELSRARPSRLPWVLGLGAVVALVAAVGLGLGTRGEPDPAAPPQEESSALPVAVAPGPQPEAAAATPSAASEEPSPNTPAGSLPEPEETTAADATAVDAAAVDAAAEESAAVDAAAEESAAEESASGDPAAAAPPAEDPSAASSTEIAAVDEPAVDEPAVDEPAVDEPAVDEPAVDEPVAAAVEAVSQAPSAPPPDPGGKPSKVTITGNVYGIDIRNTVTQRSYHSGDQVPPGDYQVFLRFPDEHQAHPVHSFRASGGWEVKIRCVARDKTCQ